MLNARLMIEKARSGAMNMAVDESLMDHAQGSRQITLRFYQWDQPTLSLGYFQKFEDRKGHAASSDCECVRRNSGGGAILHDHELTYSLTVPLEVSLADSPQQLYEIMHQGLIDALGSMGITAHRNQEPVAQRESNFLCFQRRAVNDVVILAEDAGEGFDEADYKICGSAQRKRKGAISQHGSVLLRRSACAPELPGIVNLSSTELSIDELVPPWVSRIESMASLDFAVSGLADHEESAAETLEKEKFGSRKWTERR